MIRTVRTALPLVLTLVASAGQAEEALKVEIITATAAPLAQAFRLVGTVEAAQSVPGAFRSGGRITEMAVELGDRVAAGDVIARLDATQAEAARSGAQASLDAAEVALAQAVADRDRAQASLDRGVGTQAQLDAAAEAFLAAQARRDQAAAQLSSADQAVKDTVLTADADAIVTDRLADLGEIVGAGQQVVTLASEGAREAVFYSPDLAGLADFLGQPVEIIPDDGAPIRVEVTEISPVLTATGTVEVRAVLPADAVPRTAIGATVEGHITLPGAPMIQLPWTALTSTHEGPAVWTVDPATDAVTLTAITIASYADDSIAVAGGIAPGTLVVGAGSQSLYTGALVAAAPEAAQ